MSLIMIDGLETYVMLSYSVYYDGFFFVKYEYSQTIT